MKWLACPVLESFDEQYSRPPNIGKKLGLFCLKKPKWRLLSILSEKKPKWHFNTILCMRCCSLKEPNTRTMLKHFFFANYHIFVLSLHSHISFLALFLFPYTQALSFLFHLHNSLLHRQMRNKHINLLCYFFYESAKVTTLEVNFERKMKKLKRCSITLWVQP